MCEAGGPSSGLDALTHHWKVSKQALSLVELLVV